MKAVLLDANTLGEDIDLSPLHSVVRELHVFASTTPAELHAHLADAQLIIVNKTSIPGWAMEGSKGVFVLATGTNNIDMAAARAQGVPVFNVTNYGTASVAQHTLMLILALAAKLPLYQRDLAAGAWQQSPFFCLSDHQTLELAGKNLVVVGSGTLGAAVARLAEAFGMHVQFSARSGAAQDSRPPLDSLLPDADVLSFHCPLTEETHHLLNRERLARIKPSCLVVNCARGGIIDEEAALQALIDGRIGGLAVDVLPEEPPRSGHVLLDALDKGLNLIVTPHNAWISREARQKIIDMTTMNIRLLLSRLS